MPKRWELEELTEKCVKYLKTYNGVNGYLFVGPNRNRIFLPAAGYDRCTHETEGIYGNYWSGTSSGVSSDAESMNFYDHSDKKIGTVFQVGIVREVVSTGVFNRSYAFYFGLYWLHNANFVDDPY